MIQKQLPNKYMAKMLFNDIKILSTFLLSIYNQCDKINFIKTIVQITINSSSMKSHKKYDMVNVINLICFAICIICIVAGTTISILAIWGVFETSYVFLRSLSTLGVIFLASVFTITVNKIIPIDKSKQEQKNR
jgi:hypothetical protein